MHLISPGGVDAVGSGAASVAGHIGEALSDTELVNEAVSSERWTEGLAEAAVTIAPIGSWTMLAGMPEPPAGAALVLVPEPLVPVEALSRQGRAPTR